MPIGVFTLRAATLIPVAEHLIEHTHEVGKAAGAEVVRGEAESDGRAAIGDSGAIDPTSTRFRTIQNGPKDPPARL